MVDSSSKSARLSQRQCPPDSDGDGGFRAGPHCGTTNAEYDRPDQLWFGNSHGNSTRTINPGIYSQITVSGNAKLTLNSGTYIIEGGGLTVTGNASISGHRRDHLQRRQQLSQPGWKLRRDHPERQRHVQHDRGRHRDLRRDLDLPVPAEHPCPLVQRQRHARDDRHDLCPECPAPHERQCPAPKSARRRHRST